jgi:hypothetical protein
MGSLLGFLLALSISLPAFGLGLNDLSHKDAVSGFKEALTQASLKASTQLGVADGFLGNDKVKIPLPDALKRLESGLKLLGMRRQSDELVTAMNRAAEQAVPQAKALLLEAIKAMSVADVKAILTGGETAATDYFRRTSGAQLAAKFLPIVTQVTSQAGLAQQYNRIVQRAAKLGLVQADQAKIENYVNQKTLDGLFFVISEQEKALRRDPVGSATGLARKVFELIGQ